MNKDRLEAFSDGVFSIVMTLLIFNIKVPALPEPVSDAVLWSEIGLIMPQVVIFALSFAVLSVLWINHHFIFHSFARSVDRKLNLLNLAYLMFVAFVPFSAAFIGEYHTHEPAAVVYGINIFAIVFISSRMVSYIKQHKELFSEHISVRLVNQARFRSVLSLFCYSFGIAFAYVSVPVSVFLYTFPIIFNIVPGTLDLAERIFRFDLGERR